MWVLIWSRIWGEARRVNAPNAPVYMIASHHYRWEKVPIVRKNKFDKVDSNEYLENELLTTKCMAHSMFNRSPDPLNWWFPFVLCIQRACLHVIGTEIQPCRFFLPFFFFFFFFSILVLCPFWIAFEWAHQKSFIFGLFVFRFLNCTSIRTFPPLCATSSCRQQ